MGTDRKSAANVLGSLPEHLLLDIVIFTCTKITYAGSNVLINNSEDHGFR